DLRPALLGPPQEGLYFFGALFSFGMDSEQIRELPRALGLDVGSKTIGLALTDEVRIAAHPLTVLSRAGNSGDARAVAAVVAEHGVVDVVVGMPFELSGKRGHRARRVDAFVAALRGVLPAGVQLHEQDERF